MHTTISIGIAVITMMLSVVAPAHSGMMDGQHGMLTVAMRAGLGLRAIAAAIHPYPTQAEVIKKVANVWRKTTLTERKQRILRRWFTWTRGR